MAALSTIHDVTDRSRVRVIYPWDIYGLKTSVNLNKKYLTVLRKTSYFRRYYSLVRFYMYVNTWTRQFFKLFVLYIVPFSLLLLRFTDSRIMVYCTYQQVWRDLHRVVTRDGLVIELTRLGMPITFTPFPTWYLYRE
jgi:hypothetical protein